MDERLEQALRDLESLTKALLRADRSDFAALTLILRQRADAVRRVALLAEAGAITREEPVERLRTAASAGNEAARLLRRENEETASRSVQMTRLLRAVNPADNTDQNRRGIDFAG